MDSVVGVAVGFLLGVGFSFGALMILSSWAERRPPLPTLPVNDKELVG